MSGGRPPLIEGNCIWLPIWFPPNGGARVWEKPNGQPNENVSPNNLHLGMIAYWYKAYIRGDRKKKLVWFG